MNSACPGCGLDLPAVEGPCDPYGASSPACWAEYGEIMAREFSDASHFASHGMSVDAYMAQHPSRSSRASIQSVWVHLAGLCVVLERGATGPLRGRLMAKMTAPKRDFEWLVPPLPGTTSTVASVRDGEGSHASRVRTWAESVWASWAPHHGRIRSEVDAAEKAFGIGR